MVSAFQEDPVVISMCLGDLLHVLRGVAPQARLIFRPGYERVRVHGATLASADVAPWDLVAGLPGRLRHGPTFAGRAADAGAVALLSDRSDPRGGPPWSSRVPAGSLASLAPGCTAPPAVLCPCTRSRGSTGRRAPRICANTPSSTSVTLVAAVWLPRPAVPSARSPRVRSGRSERPPQLGRCRRYLLRPLRAGCRPGGAVAAARRPKGR